MTVTHAYVLATQGMNRHGAYVGLSRHRDSMALHYGRDDFRDQSKLVHIAPVRAALRGLADISR